jgi:hypothetical protein
MDAVDARVLEALHRLVDEQRDRCLWYRRRDYYPRTLPEALRILDAIDRHADRATFQATARIRAWLASSSSGRSAGS